MKGYVTGIILNLTSTLLMKFSGLAIGIAIIHNLGPKVFAQYSIAVATIVLFGSTVATSITLSSSVNNNDRSEIFSSYIYSSILVLIYFSILVPSILIMPSNDEFGVFSKLLVVFMILLQAPALSALNALGYFKQYSAYSLISSIAFIVALYLVINNNSGKDAYFILYGFTYFVVGLLVNAAVMHLLVKEFGYGICNYLSINKAFKHIKHVLEVILASVIIPLGYWVVYNHLGSIESNIILIAIFASSMQWNLVFSQISAALGNVVISRLSSGGGAAEYLNTYFSWLAVSCLALVITTFPEIHSIAFGEEMIITDMTLNFVMVAAVINAFKSSIYRKIISRKLGYLSILSNAIWLSLFLSLVFFLKVSTPELLALIYLVSIATSLAIFYPLYTKLGLVSVSFRSEKLSVSLIALCAILVFPVEFESIPDRLLLVLCTFLILGSSLFIDYKTSIKNEKI